MQRGLEAVLGPSFKPHLGGGASVFSSKSGSKSKSKSGSKSRLGSTTTDSEGGECGGAGGGGGDDSGPCVAMICNPMAEASLATSPKLHTVFEELGRVPTTRSQPVPSRSVLLSVGRAGAGQSPPTHTKN